MKKVLLATTAMVLSAGVAYAEVSISGNARMGLQSNDGTTTFEKRMTVTMSGSGETASGLTFGATLNIRSNEGGASITDDSVSTSGTGVVTGSVSANTNTATTSTDSIGGAVLSGARVHVAANGFEVGMGNINGAIEYMPGVYSASAGLTGLGWGGVLANTSATGYWNWDAYSSSGNGAEGVEVMYTAGSLSAHLSFSDSDLGSGADRTAGYVSYAMGDWTVAAGMQESTVAAEDKTLVTVGGKVGDFGVGFGWADNGGETKIALNGSATMGAVTISAYVADEESATDQPMGLGVAYDLGGAKVVGGVARTAAGVTRADAGVSFSF